MKYRLHGFWDAVFERIQAEQVANEAIEELWKSFTGTACSLTFLFCHHTKNCYTSRRKIDIFVFLCERLQIFKARFCVEGVQLEWSERVANSDVVEVFRRCKTHRFHSRFVSATARKAAPPWRKIGSLDRAYFFSRIPVTRAPRDFPSYVSNICREPRQTRD